MTTQLRQQALCCDQTPSSPQAKIIVAHPLFLEKAAIPGSRESVYGLPSRCHNRTAGDGPSSHLPVLFRSVEPQVKIKPPGGDLFSHTLANAVSSALRRFTSVFGMGTGGAASQGPPGDADSQCTLLVPCRQRSLRTTSGSVDKTYDEELKMPPTTLTSPTRSCEPECRRVASGYNIYVVVQ